MAPYNPIFSDAVRGEPAFYGKNVKILEMYKGYPRRTNGRYYLSVTIPLLSSLFGVLLPPDLFKYIPLEAFGDLAFEFKLNPYAFYTSGY